MIRLRKPSTIDAAPFTSTPTALALAISMALSAFSGSSLAVDNNPFEPLVVSAPSSLSALTGRSAGGPDSDGDGIRNQDDLDDDNDGLTDKIEGGVDNDGDGFPDNNSVDTDGDGTPDMLDLDSDNDGILDNMEARESRDAVKALDQVPNGAIDIGIPVGSNGLADEIETWPGSGELKFPVPDTDQDGIPDFRDLDSDADGIYDVIEAGGVDNDTDGRLDGFYDADGKGVDDTVQGSAMPLFDTDGDGQLDFRDLDSDADTIPDRVEAGGNPSFPSDTDGDGAPDYRESDSDGDGRGDRQEAGADVNKPKDSDGDGVPDYQDAQANGNDTSGGDNNGNGDSGQQNDDDRPDRDGDGIANQDDLDDDNDTILDTEEGIIDADGDGVADAGSRDTDGDGTPDGNDLDSDNDGILDIYEGRYPDDVVATLDLLLVGAVSVNIPVGANGVPDRLETSVDSGLVNDPLFDTDGDGTPDYLDIDSDNDGIADLVEAGGTDKDANGRVDNFVDVDSKGVDDKVQNSALPRFDTDSDGKPDYRDTDSDADGIPDSVEGAGNLAKPTDSDGDGAADYRETDSDNDGVKDAIEAGPDKHSPVDTNGDGTPDFQDASMQYTGDTTPPDPVDPGTGDHDGDGVADAMDDDDDNDGIKDSSEGDADSDSDGVVNRLDADSDNDGILDSVEGKQDSDGDSVPDFLDLDSDNDGGFDALEAGRVNVSATGRLMSANTVDANGLGQGASQQENDTDKDGIADRLDLDSDNDGLPDVVEHGHSDADLNARIDGFVDANGDGVHDPISGNSADLPDADGDRLPNARDLDSDQDGLSDLAETLGLGADQDNDGRVDNFIDANNDGLDDNVAAHLNALPDIDGDSLPNSLDLDSDGDGVKDLVEAGGQDVDNDGRVDLLKDSDGDGIADKFDVDVTGGEDKDGDGIDDLADIDYVNGVDSDGDGIADSKDSDADGDGFVGPLNDAGDAPLAQGEPVNLPDSDGDGVPDIRQNTAASGRIETGLGGSGFGCSILPAGGNASPDPLFLILLGGSVLFLSGRKLRHYRRRDSLPSKAVVCVAGASVLSGCGVIDLAPERDFERRVYAGVGGLASKLEPDTDGIANTSVSDSDSSGASATLGYDINNRLSVEGHLADLGEAGLSPAGSVGYSVAGVSGVVYGLNDARDRSRRGGFSVFGKLGLGAMANSAEVVQYRRVNDMHLLAGVGLEYGLDNGLGVRAELVAHETDAKFAQLGLIYRFGDAADPRSRPVSGSSSASQGSGVQTNPSSPSAVVTPVPGMPAATGDRDGDGVADAADACPGSAANSPVRANGCEIFDGVIEGITFKTGSATLTQEAIGVLAEVAQALEDHPELRVSIEAHTDNLGEASSNLQLSKRRAIAVASYLVDRGISGSRLKPRAYGESKPRMSNRTSSGRAANRRVEFSIIP